MAGGSALPSGSSKQQHRRYEGHVTIYFIFASLVAASAGLVFGYDIGISGGVTSMDDFLQKFFPKVYRNEKSAKTDNYCRYNSQTLQLFNSSIYIAGAIAPFFASYLTKHRGRTASMLCGGLSSLAGAILNGAAQNLSMLIIGRILLGVGIGFSGQAAALYLSEMAIPTRRGFFNLTFQSAVTIGIFSGNLINYGTGKIVPNGWRISLSLAAVPALILTLGGIFLPDSPHSLVERGQVEKGRRVLERIRGVKNVDTEFEDLLEGTHVSKSVKHPWAHLFQRRYRPQLVITVSIPFFQTLTGNTAITLYAPVLFRTVGFGSNPALYSAVILGSVKVLSTWISMLIVDRWGRKVLFLQGGIQMATCELAVAIIMKLKLGSHGPLDHTLAVVVLTLFCLCEGAFDWSWAPLTWLVPSEILPLEVRSAAMSLTVGVHYFFTFVIQQLFLTIFCHFKSFTFVFFAGWVVFMTLFTLLLLPETKNVPLEESRFLFANHWFWKRYGSAGAGAADRKVNADLEGTPVKTSSLESRSAL